MRLKQRQEHNAVALTVIYFLGTIAAVATLASAYLIHECIVYEDGLNAAAVALVGQMVSISTLALGALGAMLSSTSPKPPPPPTMPDGSPAPIPVEGVRGGEPVPVAPAPPDGAEDPAAGGEADPAETADLAVVEGPRGARGRRGRGHPAPEGGHVNAVFVIVGTCVVALGLVFGTLLLRLV